MSGERGERLLWKCCRKVGDPHASAARIQCRRLANVAAGDRQLVRQITDLRPLAPIPQALRQMRAHRRSPLACLRSCASSLLIEPLLHDRSSLHCRAAGRHRKLCLCVSWEVGMCLRIGGALRAHVHTFLTSPEGTALKRGISCCARDRRSAMCGMAHRDGL